LKELSIIIPAYNEEKRIKDTLNNYIKYLNHRFSKKCELIIVTDGSVDSTPKIVDGFAKRYSFIKHIKKQYRLGKGGAIQEGFKYANGKIIGFVDADNSTSLKSIDNLLTQMNNHDGVIASRWLNGAKIMKKEPMQRQVASRAFNVLVRLLFGLPFKDTQCGAKFFKRGAVIAIVNELGLTDWAFDVDLLHRMHKKGFKIKEIPVTWTYKKHSKLNLKKTTIKMFFSIIGLRIKRSPLAKVIPPKVFSIIYEKVKKI